MKIIKQTTARNVALLSCLSWAAVAAANNELQNISINEAAAGKVEVLLNFSSPVAIPKGFVMENPPRIVFDFPGVEVAPGARHNNTKRGVLNAVQAAGTKGQARLVFNLDSLVDYTVESSGNDMVLLFSPTNGNTTTASRGNSAQDGSATHSKVDDSYDWYKKPGAEPTGNQLASQKTNPAAQAASQVAPPGPAVKLEELPPPPRVSQPLVYRPGVQAPAQPRKAPRPPVVNALAEVASIHGLRSVDFRREPDGGGRVIVTLPDSESKVTDDKIANTLNLILEDTDVPTSWQKRLDVVDFATPVSNIQISQRGMNGRVSIMASEDFTYRTERDKNIYTVYIDKIKAPKKEKLGEKKKKVFTGEKLSLNFQDIEVRAVLQLLADFTNKNIVVSDSVDGNITVRLKDVPWDQALDIVLESKNLGMRENGNVIWVAPNTELDAKDAQEIEVAKRKVELEPLVTEYVPINFAKAADLSTLIKSKSATEGDSNHSLLSARGSVSSDDRT
ncbi:MAG TPA: secretin and TonB N-terminal domain-containing protein, partial [Thiolinea sp.]|nr:secretin and TonB N-terminal domain-containing protein [Thiolinea sp.]